MLFTMKYGRVRHFENAHDTYMLNDASASAAGGKVGFTQDAGLFKTDAQAEGRGVGVLTSLVGEAASRNPPRPYVM